MTLSTINSHSSKANYKMFTSQGNQLVNRACCDSAQKNWFDRMLWYCEDSRRTSSRSVLVPVLVLVRQTCRHSFWGFLMLVLGMGRGRCRHRWQGRPEEREQRQPSSQTSHSDFESCDLVLAWPN